MFCTGFCWGGQNIHNFFTDYVTHFRFFSFSLSHNVIFERLIQQIIFSFKMTNIFKSSKILIKSHYQSSLSEPSLLTS